MKVKETQAENNTKLYLTILFTVVASVILIVILRHEKGSTPKSAGPIQLGLAAPDFTFPSVQGQMVSLSGHRGKVVLVNIWATWCPPCRKEMPSMQKLYERFKGNDFEILAVSIDSTGREAVAPFMREMNLTFPALLDPNESIKPLYGITGIPESFIIDRKGIVVEKIVGPIDWATSEVFNFIQGLIKKPGS